MAPGRPTSTWAMRSSTLTVGAKFGEVDVVDADDFAACGVDDLLVEEIFADGEPAIRWDGRRQGHVR